MSHLLQMRGLKLKNGIKRIWKGQVASFTDAWIETAAMPSPVPPADVASFTDAWIETFAYSLEGLHGLSHLLQMRGLKHFSLDRKHHRHESHLLQMRGLKPLI